MMDFSQGASADTPNSLIPKGQLAWAILQVRAIKQSTNGGQYLDCELTIDEGQPYARKKLWDMIGDPNFAGNSEQYRQSGMVAITRILEAGRGAGPNNVAGYQINSYEQLTGLRVAIKIGVEKGKDGYDDKNRVADYLTPNPASQSGHKPFLKLQAGEYAPAQTGQQQAAQKQAQGGFGFGQQQQQAQPQQQASFGQQQGQQTQQVQSQAAQGGFGNGGGQQSNQGFTQPQSNNAGSAAQNSGAASQANGFAQTGTATAQSPSNSDGAPNWLKQANGG